MLCPSGSVVSFPTCRQKDRRTYTDTHRLFYLLYTDNSISSQIINYMYPFMIEEGVLGKLCLLQTVWTMNLVYTPDKWLSPRSWGEVHGSMHAYKNDEIGGGLWRQRQLGTLKTPIAAGSNTEYIICLIVEGGSALSLSLSLSIKVSKSHLILPVTCCPTHSTPNMNSFLLQANMPFFLRAHF